MTLRPRDTDPHAPQHRCARRPGDPRNYGPPPTRATAVSPRTPAFAVGKIDKVSLRAAHAEVSARS
ncbi:hypothetical protein AB5J49_40900 [Streptomyces sp. R28]|uniref:Uncharacterized protein n=1 Tax=Streptomyces sp. R28 TaxID=3238628 RepID=A0AB39Q9J8_9ACTN